MNETLKSTIDAKLKARDQKGQLRRLTIFENENLADFSSNDYLSLSSDGEFYRQYLAQLKHQASHGQAREMAMGSGGSRLLDGNSARAERLERETLPQFHRAPDGLLFGSGFDANVGVYSSLAQPGDVIVYDELVHASVHDGMRLARAARYVPFAHNDAAALQATLAAIKAKHKAANQGQEFCGQVFVGVESVYSMDGDVAPLRALLHALRAEFPRTGHLIVDEAHATGVVGPGGRGLVCALGLETDVLVRVHTFGKGVGAAGAVVLCDSLLREYFINYCRPFVYSTAMPGYALAAIEAAYALLASPVVAAPRLARLWARMYQFHAGLSTLSVPPADDSSGARSIYYAAAGSGAPLASAIFAVQTPQARALATHCRRAARCLVRAIVYPTVPRGGERVRVCLHAGNTRAEVDALLQALRAWTEGAEDDELMQDEPKPRLWSALGEKSFYHV